MRNARINRAHEPMPKHLAFMLVLFQSFLAKKETMDGGNDDDPLSPDLSCQENPEFVYDEVPVENPDDGINNLIDIEIGFGFQRDEALIIPNWVLEVRSESITWALNKTAAFGFQSSTVVYLFVTYFDRFISLTSIAMPIVEERPEIRLLSVACLSLAAWTERMMLPPLSQHEDGDYFFATGSIVQKAHGVVTALGWDMDIITPFAFLDYLVSKLWQRISTRCEISDCSTPPFCNDRISVPDLNFLETDAVFFLYHLMQERLGG
ncbi:hypothetical protein C1H46_003671 [Malus baccata]|uniref:B-like cyclin n=1 Tax=Malus baccata TaxID=106549 RepID=A0A540NI94_MALBA|nr:hypothetical protein C1H46_003671 [Malus baccata]